MVRLLRHVAKEEVTVLVHAQLHLPIHLFIVTKKLARIQPRTPAPFLSLEEKRGKGGKYDERGCRLRPAMD